jgi:DNA-binding transcriptional regulator GbsR (MarR family)
MSGQSNQEKLWEKLEEARERVIRAIATNIDLYGVPSSIGRLYGTMYFHDEPMTLDEMSDALGMSKTSMSTGVRSLLDIKMVQKTYRKGVRKDLYIVEEDWYQSFFHLFSSKWGRAIQHNEKEISLAKQQIEDIYQQAEDEELKETLSRDLAKLEHALEYYTWLKKLVKAFETGEIFEFIPKPSSRNP